MIQKAAPKDARLTAELALKLWPEHTVEELEGEFRLSLRQEESTVFLCFMEDTAVGFAQCGLRHDYVEGTSTSPVGYLEGIFVEEAYRQTGCAKELLCACEAWAKGKGCEEFASDCELTNSVSLQFHLHCGFEEANRIICFTKKL